MNRIIQSLRRYAGRVISGIYQGCQSAAIAVWQPHKKKLLIAAGTLLLMGVAWINQQPDYAERLSKGQNALNIGDYAEAKNQFEEAIKTNPLQRIAAIATIFVDKDNKESAKETIQQALDILHLSDAARLGVRKASVFIDLKERETIAQELTQLGKRYPDDGDIKTLWGKYNTSLYKFDDAMPYFQRAIQLNPQAAEAYFGLCEIYDIRNDLDKAVDMCQKAVEIAEKLIASKPANYVINLALIYAQTGEQEKAKALIADLQAAPTTYFELGKIYFFTNQLEKAIIQLKLSLDFLNKPEAQTESAWYYKTKDAIVFLPKVEDKKCYVTYSLAMSAYLNNSMTETENFLKNIDQLCGARHAEIKKIVGYDLEIAQKNSALSKRAGEFEKHYLK